MTTTNKTKTKYFDMIGDENALIEPDAGPQGVNLHDPASYYADIQRVLDHFDRKTPDYEKAQDFFKGNLGEFFASDYIRDILEETGDAYLCNFAGRVVEEVYNRLAIQSIQIRLPGQEISSPFINTSLDDNTSGGTTGASSPGLSAGPELPEAPSDRAGTNPATDAARDAVLGHSTADDPAAQSAASTANNTITPNLGTNGTNGTHNALPLPDGDTAGSLALQRMWDEVYRKNKLANFFPRWIKQALIYGDGYAMAWDDGADGVQTQVLDPLTTCVIYDEENNGVELYSARFFKTSTGARRINLYYDKTIVKLVTKARAAGDKPEDYIPYIDPLDEVPDEFLDVERRNQAGAMGNISYPFVTGGLDGDATPSMRYAFLAAQSQLSEAPGGQPGADGAAHGGVLEQLADQQAISNALAGMWPAPNPHGRQPIFHLRTTDDDTYGVPEHYESYGPQNAINKLIAVQMGTTDAAGFPARYALQKSGTIDQNAFDEDEDEELPPDSHIGAVQDEPGAINILKDVDSLIQLAGADPDGFLKPMLQYIKFMSFVCATPMSFYDTLGQMPSDSTQRENTGPLIMKCGARKRVMTPTGESFVEFLLSIMGVRGIVVHVQWEQSQMVNDLQGWQVLTGKLALGVPFEQVMQEAGYTPAQIAQWDPPSTGLTSKVAMALQIAQAAQALAASVVAGVVDAADAHDLIQSMFVDLKNTPVGTSSRANVSFRG